MKKIFFLFSFGVVVMLQKAQAQLHITPFLGASFEHLQTQSIYQSFPTVGILTQYTFKSRWATSLRIALAQRNYELLFVNRNFTQKYLEFSPSIDYKFNKYLDFFGGIYTGINVGAVSEVRRGEAQDMPIHVKSADLGVSLGFRTHYRNIMFGVGFNQGLTPISNYSFAECATPPITYANIQTFQRSVQVILGYTIAK